MQKPVFLLLMLICLVLPGTLLAQNFNRPVPSGVPAYEFVQYDSTVSGYYLTAPFKIGLPAPEFTHLMILDQNGYLCWYKPVDARNLLDFTFNPEHQRYTYVEFKGPQNVGYIVLNTNLELEDSFTTTNGIEPDIHDFQITENKTYLLAGARDSIMNLSGYIFNGMPGSPTTNAIGFVVQEFDEDHNLLFQWNSNDYIHPSQAYGAYGYNAANFDYCHGNTIEEDLDGNLLISFRHLNAVYKIDRQSGAVLWRLGGKTSSFSFPNDLGFSGQHDTRVLPNGNIAMFDNANTAPPPRISRAVEYALDTVNWTATKVWEYKYDPGFFSIAMGGHQTTANREHLVNYGLIYRPRPTFVLSDDAGNVLSEAFFQDSFMSYRSSFYDLPLGNLTRPEIQCTQTNGVVTLSAPVGHTQYEWSTGENTQSIELSNTGVFQLWVNEGEGMAGSAPYVIEDLTTACPMSSQDEPQSIDNQTIVDYFDLLGRRLSAPPRPGFAGQVFLVRYSDGKFRLKAFN
jgi:hypothetical protein